MKLLIRADAGPRIGHGHVMRCLALAQAGRSAGVETVFRMHLCPVELEKRLVGEDFCLQPVAEPPGSEPDAQATARAAHELGSGWVVADGYQFDTTFQSALRSAGRRLLVIDDYAHCARYEADLILNQNLGASEMLYARRAKGTRLLLGTSFALLRKEFLELDRTAREIPERIERVLLTMGGADPDNVTLKALRGLRGSRCEAAHITVVVGSSFAHDKEIAPLCRELSVELLRDVRDMSGLLMRTDLAIAAGGSTNWELAFFGVPAIILVLAENQQQNAAQLDRAGIAVNLGPHTKIEERDLRAAIDRVSSDEGLRRGMGKKGRELIDGQGAHRVLSALGVC